MVKFSSCPEISCCIDKCPLKEIKKKKKIPASNGKIFIAPKLGDMQILMDFNGVGQFKN